MAPHRAEPVTCYAGDQVWRGEQVSSAGRRLVVRFDSHDAGPRHLPLGATLRVESGPDATLIDAHLVMVELERPGTLRATMELGVDLGGRDDPSDDEERRVWLRTAEQAVVRVPVRLMEGPVSGRQLVAQLKDASAGGLALILPRAAEPRLCLARTLRATMSWPGIEGERAWTCDVRNRSLVEGGVRYGVQFRTETGGIEPEGPQYEATWDCGFCGQPTLLADTHAHCPGCGMAHGASPTQLPDWDALVTAATHRFGGTEVSCGACGVAHAAIAVHCAHCGEIL